MTGYFAAGSDEALDHFSRLSTSCAATSSVARGPIGGRGWMPLRRARFGSEWTRWAAPTGQPRDRVGLEDVGPPLVEAVAAGCPGSRVSHLRPRRPSRLRALEVISGRTTPLRRELRVLGPRLRRRGPRFPRAVGHGDDIALCAPGRNTPPLSAPDVSAPSGLQTALNSASGGAVICLNAGTYAAISLSSKSYSSDVRVQPASGAAVVLGGATLNAVAHLHITGIGRNHATLRIGDVQVDARGGCSRHLTFDHYTATGGVNVIPKYACSHHMAILFDHDRFDNLTSETWEGRFNVQAYDTGPSRPKRHHHLQ